MSQPNWKQVCSTDTSRLLVDTTGVYPPEMEIAQEDEGAKRFYVYRVVLDPVKKVGKYLVPAGYTESWTHPVHSYNEWYAKDLASVARSCGTTKAKLVAALCSDEPQDRAWAYDCIGGHHGFDNFDSDPLVLTERELNMRWHGHFVDVDADDPEIDIELTAEEEDIPIEGNALASGDDAEDAAENERIRSELARGNEWAWCTAHVRVTYKGLVTADAYLGACSYRNADDFRRDGGYDDMVSECLAEINAKLKDIGPA